MDNDGVASTPLFLVKSQTTEERLLHLEAHQLSMAASMMRSIAAINENTKDAEIHLRCCIGHVHTLYALMWMLAVLNMVLLAVLIWREMYR